LSVPRLRRWALIPALLSICTAWLTAGCGGGGGGAASSPFFGRTFLFSSGTQLFVLSADAAGRFTAFLKDGTLAPSGSGGQGNISTDGQFAGQTDDGQFQFTGTVALGGGSVSGTVTRNSVNVFNYAATQVGPGSRLSDTLTGTFFGASGANSIWLTIDPNSHGVLWARTSTMVGGGLVNVNPDGTFSSSDAATAGSVTVTGSTSTIRITKLNGAAVDVTVSSDKSSRAKWTFMVFLNAANDLQEFAALNVNQMEKVGSTADVNIIVQWKQANCAGCGAPDWVGTRRYFVTKDNNTSAISSQLLQDMGTGVDMGKAQTLKDFITWGQQRYPADRYAVVIWNHGAGWRPTRAAGRNNPPPFRSVSIDDDTRSEIQIWELPNALNVTPKIDMVIFDASLMQMLETAYEMRNSTGIIVGSEESPPGAGYVYDGFLADLVANPAMSPSAFGTQIVTRTLQAYGSNGNNTQSVIDTTKLENVAAKLDDFANSLLSNITSERPAMIAARVGAESYAYPENKDLYHYAELIRVNVTNTALKNAAAALQTAIRQAVIAEAHGILNRDSNGIAIYVPPPASYLPSYSNIALSARTKWDEFLQAQPP
jgi:hypothetical protein